MDSAPGISAEPVSSVTKWTFPSPISLDAFYKEYEGCRIILGPFEFEVEWKPLLHKPSIMLRNVPQNNFLARRLPANYPRIRISLFEKIAIISHPGCYHENFVKQLLKAFEARIQRFYI